ncbi:uncharacterized protein DNG_06383 [Cephalotrichum gorgonifer]|uniref:NAD(P)-binding protein n=1 Tax=Cephalotrichum gorgonifer TaxID=2041049 RepID=A0AAE8N2M7_9PEZI|nr:uncharacterized protein DNG_06383 [Cephalotrichum gorgonifer]
MVKFEAIQAHNATLKSLAPGLVAAFVGGTSGISLSTALALARHTNAPKIYLIGRSQSAADEAIASMQKINPSAQPTFIQADVSLLKNVDTVCEEIAAKEKALNLLFMTPGVGPQGSRIETAEGLDRKVGLHYYTRMRFINKLLPLLTAAAEDTTRDEKSRLSRVVSVLDPHGPLRTPFGSAALDYADLSLKNTWSVSRCATHATAMTDFYFEGLASKHPRTSFVHSYPSAVATGIMRDMPFSKVILKLSSPFLVPLEESGERHLYLATHPSFAPRVEAARAGVDAAVGSDGVKGSGSYWANWDDNVFAPKKKLEETRGTGAVEKVTQHTEEVFKRICEEGKTYA